MANNKNKLSDKLNKTKRSVLENGLSALTVAGLLIMVLLIALFLIIFPRSSVSNIEKRTLATFPTFSFGSYFSGEFTSGITTYYDDTVPFRDGFKNMGNNMKSLFGIHTDDTVEFVGSPIAVVDDTSSEVTSDNNTSDTNSKTSSDKSNDTTSEESSQTDFTKQEAKGNYENGTLIIKQNGHWRGLELFGGGTGDNYISSLKKLRNKVDKSVKIYSMPAPLASEFYTPSNYSQYNSSQKKCFDSIAKALGSSIISVDAVTPLSKHTEEDIYCRTDHHWQALGAYYATQEFAKEADVPFIDLSEYEKESVDGFVGSLYTFSQSSNLLNDPETFTYYVPNTNYTTDYYEQNFTYSYTGDLLPNVDVANSYMRFLGGDGYVTKVTTDLDSTRKLLIIKDSYGNAIVPFLTGSFKEIYVVDMRYFERNLVSFIDDMNITDVLFTCASYSVVGDNADNIATLISQNSGESIKDDAPKSKYSTTSKKKTTSSESSSSSES